MRFAEIFIPQTLVRCQGSFAKRNFLVRDQLDFAIIGSVNLVV